MSRSKSGARSYDVRPPGGESLKDTAERVLPYYDSRIKPSVLKGETILIAAHGNSLRALVMQLEQLTREQVLELNIPTGAPLLYELDNSGKVCRTGICNRSRSRTANRIACGCSKWPSSAAAANVEAKRTAVRTLSSLRFTR